VEFINARLTATAPAGGGASTELGAASIPQHDTTHDAAHLAERDVYIDGAYVQTPVYQREALAAHAMVGGPALIEQYDTCTYVPPGWSAKNTGATLVVEHL
jgi:N-methylhydantoinase A